MTRPAAPKHAARKKRATRKAVMAPSPSLQIPPLPVGAIVKYGLMILTLAVGYGKMQSDVGHLKADVESMKSQVNAIYEHLAFRETGAAGPAVIPDPPQGE